MIPVSILTGYLGSGKTTILSKLLGHPDFADTAVIINEFGEIGLDHDLIETSEEDLVTLKTGCLCCRMRGDLVATLDDLYRKRAACELPHFSRVVIETSGLADPAPILHSLMIDADIATRFAHPNVVTVVDAVNGSRTLDNEHEAQRQVALADRLVITKTDLDGTQGQTLDARLRTLNQAAPVSIATFGAIDPADVVERPANVADLQRTVLADFLGDDQPTTAHSDGEISTFTLHREEPLAAAALSLFLQALGDHCGTDLLRMKGLVAVAERPDRPCIIHGVQHVFHPPSWLDHWPGDDRRSRIVFIGRRLDREWMSRLLRAIELEVAEVSGNSKIGEGIDRE